MRCGSSTSRSSARRRRASVSKSATRGLRSQASTPALIAEAGTPGRNGFSGAAMNAEIALRGCAAAAIAPTIARPPVHSTQVSSASVPSRAPRVNA